MSTFPPVADYAFLSNCEQSCLVAPDGSVEWLCLPRPDSPSVFGALLDRTAGEFRFGPTGAQVPHHRRYVPGTMVLETTWHTPTGWLVVHDLLVMGRTDVSHRRTDYRRAPTDFGATGVLLRTATCIGGQVEVLVDCSPLFSYGAAGGTWSYRGEGYVSMRVAGRGDHLAARDSGRGAQLGLPLHLDPGLGVHAPIAVRARFRLGGDRVSRLHHRRRQQRRPRRAVRAADHVRHRR